MDIKIQGIDNGALVPGDGVSAFHFGGGLETHVNFLPNFTPFKDYVLTMNDGSFQSVGDALVIADGLRRMGVKNVHLFAPYLPAARQDRGAPFSAKVYADAINLGEFATVVAVDPHSPVMPSFLNNLVTIDAVDVISPALITTEDTTIIAPDHGARERASLVAERYNLPLVIAEKHRDPENNFRVAEYTCDSPETKYAIVIDDICDGGATFNFLADAIKMPAQNLTLWTTHGIYSAPVGLDRLHENYGVIATTDSFRFHATPDVIVPLEDLMLKSIQ